MAIQSLCEVSFSLPNAVVYQRLPVETPGAPPGAERTPAELGVAAWVPVLCSPINWGELEESCYSVAGSFVLMRRDFLLSITLLITASLASQLKASTFDFRFTGPGVNGTIQLTYGTATDGKYSNAFEITGVAGTFSDSNNSLNLANVPVGSLIAIRHDTPDSTNLLAPHDFSRFAVASGLSPMSNGFLTYDNLYWPGGSPQTASDYPLHGGLLDIYGLMFNIGGGRVVDIWSNGDLSGTGTGHIDYGVAVATASAALDYVSGGVSVTPEPSAFALAGSSLLGVLVWRRRAGFRSRA
jgi:PEP-CTERM motif-containing protein